MADEPLSDGELLTAFAERRDEAALAMVVERHAMLVLNVCRGVLGNSQDSEDAAQATFIALAQKAGKLKANQSVAFWLHHVAYGVAIDALRARSSRIRREQGAAMMARMENQANQSCEDFKPLLAVELDALPRKYREAIVLFHLEGRSLEQTAAALQCPVNTVSSRLARGRELLRKRLTRRGVMIPAVALASLLSVEAGATELPATFVAATVKAASSFVMGQAVAAGGAAISPQVVALTKGALKAMFYAKLKLAALVMAAVSVLGSATGVVVFRVQAEENNAVGTREANGKSTAPRIPVVSRQAATIKAASVSYSDVAAAVAKAVDGDTVVVPAGTASWTSTLTITKSITLQGATTITGGSTWPTASAPTVTDSTIILDDIPRDALHKKGAIVYVSGAPSLRSFRLTGFTFSPGALTTDSGCSILSGGINPALRVDHIHFNQLHVLHTMELKGWNYGVIDHNVVDTQPKVPGTVGSGGNFCSQTQINWDRQPSGWGSWAAPTNFGSAQFLFFEDNWINNHVGNPGNGGSIDGEVGARFVVRYNAFNNGVEAYHGTDSGSGGGTYLRGTRAVEIYNNTFTAPAKAQGTIFGGVCRSGTLLWHGNIFTGPYAGGTALMPYRLSSSFKDWGIAANGTNPWDFNATEPDGTHVDGHAPYTYAAGTHIGGNESSTTVTVAGTPWKTNQWAGYSVTNTSGTSPYFNGATYISSNTSNTLALAGGKVMPPYPTFNTGDTFAIHKVLIVLDQPGRGQSELIIGNPPGTTNLTGTVWPRWPQQKLEPCYSWSNTLNGKNLDFNVRDSKTLLRENVDYYHQRAAVADAQTKGVGVGTLANRPTHCTIGVGYWATDENKLYVASDTDTWTLYYQPYTYPHPLVAPAREQKE